MMTQWLPDSPSPLPRCGMVWPYGLDGSLDGSLANTRGSWHRGTMWRYAFTQVGVGGIVVNSKDRSCNCILHIEVGLPLRSLFDTH